MTYQELTSTEITKSEIFSVYNRARTFARRNPSILDPGRVNRALGIVQRVMAGSYRWEYATTHDHCTCADSTYRRVTCKHSIALMLLQRILEMRGLERWEASAQVTAWVELILGSDEPQEPEPSLGEIALAAWKAA